jgi:hypothetical protein
MFAVGYVRLLLSWIMQTLYVLQIMIWSKGYKTLKKAPCPVLVVSCVMVGPCTIQEARLGLDVTHSCCSRNGEEPFLVEPSDRVGPGVEVILSGVLTEVVSTVSYFIRGRRILSLRRWTKSNS